MLSIGFLVLGSAAQAQDTPPHPPQTLAWIYTSNEEPLTPEREARLAEEKENMKRAVELYKQGNAYAKQGKIDKALETFKASFAIDVGHDYSYLRLGELYFDQGDFANAAQIFKEWRYNSETKQWKGDDIACLSKAAISWNRMGNRDLALSAYEAARAAANEQRRTEPQSPPIIVQFGDASSKYPFTPEHLEAVARTVLAISLEGYPERPLAQLREAIRLWSDLPDAHLEVARTLLFLSDHSKTRKERQAWKAEAEQEMQKATRYGRSEIREAVRLIKKQAEP